MDADWKDISSYQFWLRVERSIGWWRLAMLSDKEHKHINRASKEGIGGVVLDHDHSKVLHLKQKWSLKTWNMKNRNMNPEI